MNEYSTATLTPLWLMFFPVLATASTGLSDSSHEIANPASSYCEALGGTLQLSAADDGPVQGECHLPGRQVCEEWALFRGECGPGGFIQDPFGFCAKAGDSEVIPFGRTGGSFPESLAAAMTEQGLIRADAPSPVKQANRWRCMDGQVVVCPLGANLPCAEKADLSRDPSPGLVTYCRDNPGATVPAYVTGRATVYSWECVDSMPSIDHQVFTPDAAGYLSEFWYRLEP